MRGNIDPLFDSKVTSWWNKSVEFILTGEYSSLSTEYCYVYHSISCFIDRLTLRKTVVCLFVNLFNNRNIARPFSKFKDNPRETRAGPHSSSFSSIKFLH